MRGHSHDSVSRLGHSSRVARLTQMWLQRSHALDNRDASLGYETIPR
jgi:hypothetical protein